MANILDYMKWRGDLEFWQDSFNDFDNLILSAISYVYIDKIFEQSECDTMNLKEVSEKYFSSGIGIERFSDKSMLRNMPTVLRMAAECKRYESILIRNYVNKIDIGKTLQFSAMEFLLPDGTSYVAFRGTDDTIVGWKEDFMMAVSEVEAEKEAVDYLNHIAENSKRLLRVGGHSKGGHLAVYACVYCDEDIKDRILTIYTNDGPGFSKEFVKDKRTKAILPKVVRIIPEESIVGMLMEHVGKAKVVKSENYFVMQHDMLSWQIDGMKFELADKISKPAAAMDKAVTQWIDSFESGERSIFVDEFFSVLEASGAETICELQEGGVKALQLMTRQANVLSPNTKEKINSIIKALFLGLIKSESSQS